MAKYTVTCATCEESFTRELYGPSKDRQWKLDQTQTCKKCWKKEQREAREAADPLVQVRARRGESALIQFVIFNSFSVKEALKARGYRFSYDFSRSAGNNGFSFLSMSAPRSEGSWSRRFEGAPDAICESVAAEIQWLKEQGWQIEDATGPLAGIGFALAEGTPDYLEGVE